MNLQGMIIMCFSLSMVVGLSAFCLYHLIRTK
jgi:hypothetical protein